MLFEVKNTPINVPFDQTFAYLADASKLPTWANAFAWVHDDGIAMLRTPQGEVPIKLEVISSHSSGTIDWKMTFPDGTQGIAHSRVVALGADVCAYSFLLTPPPVPLEMLEGALAEQSVILEAELVTLKGILEEKHSGTSH